MHSRPSASWPIDASSRERALLQDPDLFRARLAEAVPTIYATHVIVALNVGVLVLGALAGVSMLAPDAETLLKIGGDNTYLVTHGQPWRLLTSMFLHAGVLHLAMNMYVLVQGGRLVERLFGATAFSVLYVLAGLFGNVVSLFLHPEIPVGVGASGAVFGVFGAAAGYLVVERRAVPPAFLRSLGAQLFQFIVLNVAIGLMVPFIDLAAHLGGLASGFVLGMALARPLTAEGVALRVPRAIAVGTAASAVLAVSIAGLLFVFGS